MTYLQKVPEWHEAGTEPSEAQKQTGFQPGMKPPAQWFNWFLNWTYLALKELQEKSAEQSNVDFALEEIQADIIQLQDDIGNADIPDASLTVKGKVQLSDVVNSTAKDKAATPSAVKLAYDEATAAKQLGVEQKNNVVAALNSIGVSASTSETWAQLIAKMAGVVRATGNATAAQVLSGATFSNATGNGRTGTMPNRGGGAHNAALSTEVWQADRTFFRAPDGYYDGQSWVFALTPDLHPSNIRFGKSILGVAGTLNEGPKYASGVATSTSDDQRVLINWERGSSFLMYYFVVNNLGFRPNRIIVRYPNFRAAPFVYTTKSRDGAGGYNLFGTTTYFNNQILEDNVRVYELAGQTTYQQAYVNDTGFLLPSMGGALASGIEWEAFGV